MMSGKTEKTYYPSLREVRRSCNKELYRTAKKLKLWIPPEQAVKAEEIYLNKVMENIQWVVENHNNRRKLADWWEENICPEIAELWNVDAAVLATAFREAFGG